MILTHSPFVPTPDSPNPESKEDMPNFVDMVEYTDKIVGKIVSHLEGLGIRENTLILFTGDNGTAGSITSTLNGLPWKGGKGTPHESGTHVPLVASWPESQVKGKVLDDLVDFSDFFPTLAELSGAEIPAGVELDGRSFAPQLNGKRGNPREWIYFWYNGKGEQESPPRTPVQWLRGKRFKLYDSGDFFDMLKDPAQKKALPPRNMSPEAKTAYEGLKPALQEMEQLAVRKRFQ
jgi:arylsulfatase A